MWGDGLGFWGEVEGDGFVNYFLREGRQWEARRGVLGGLWLVIATTTEFLSVIPYSI